MSLARRLAYVACALFIALAVSLPLIFAVHIVDDRNARRHANDVRVQTLREADRNARIAARAICESANESAHALNAALDFFRNLTPPERRVIFDGVPRPKMTDCNHLATPASG